MLIVISVIVLVIVVVLALYIHHITNIQGKTTTEMIDKIIMLRPYPILTV